MQRVYSAVLLAALALSLGSYIAIPVLVLVPNPPQGFIVSVVVMLVWLPFVAIRLMLRGMSGGALCVPCPRPVYVSIAVATTVVAVSWLAVGFLRWPAAPVRPVQGVFVDKRGSVHSKASYEAFRRWEVTLPPAWLPFALVAVTALPASGRARWVRTC